MPIGADWTWLSSWVIISPGWQPRWAWNTVLVLNARQTYCQWPRLPHRWQVSFATGRSRRKEQDVRPHHKKQGKDLDCMIEKSWRYPWRQEALDVIPWHGDFVCEIRCLFIGTQGITLWADFSSCCLVMTDSVWRLAPKSRALLMTCAKVNAVRVSREMMSHFLKVSLSPIMKICLCSLSSTAVGKLHSWYSSRT